MPQADQALTELRFVYGELKAWAQDDWLLRYEIYELLRKYEWSVPWEKELVSELQTLAKHSLERKEMIERGLRLLGVAHVS
jgi:hypothetical protein